MQSALTFLDPARRPVATGAESATTLPLPLPPALWIDAVFNGRATAATLTRDILQSRGASLLYYGALSLDDQTRAWLSGQRELVTTVVTQYPSTFAVAAPALRVAEGRVRVPGGEPAEPVWEAVVGARASDPAAFVRALLVADEGRLAAWFGATASLTPGQIQTLLSLDYPESSNRIAAVRRLLLAFERVGTGWRVEERAFWRPPLDPILLVADLPLDERGRPVVPGTTKFWSAVFEPEYSPSKSDNRNPEAAAGGEPLNFTWLCDQVFTGDKPTDRRRYQLVMFASRVVTAATPDAIEAVRAAQSHPALIATLERAGLVDVAAYARAARRAIAISAIDDDDRGTRALTQFQGAVAFLSRAALRGESCTGCTGPARDVALGAGAHEPRRLRRQTGHLARRDVTSGCQAVGAAGRGVRSDGERRPRISRRAGRARSVRRMGRHPLSHRLLARRGRAHGKVARRTGASFSDVGAHARCRRRRRRRQRCDARALPARARPAQGSWCGRRPRHLRGLER